MCVCVCVCVRVCVVVHHQEHSLCFSDCQFSHTDGNVTLSFDFGPMGSVGTLMNGPSFTSKGTKYFHQFNISLCGGEVGEGHATPRFDLRSAVELALCTYSSHWLKRLIK